MNQFGMYLRAFDSTANNIMQENINRPTIISAIVHLILVLYAARIAPTPPQAILNLFANVYFKLLIFVIILWTAQFSPSTSILIALAFMITINYTTTGKIWENLENTVVADKQTALDNANITLQTQMTNMPVVTSTVQSSNTTVITPTIVNTPSGPVVMNPSVVISSAVVSTPDGKQIIITPDVTTVSTTPVTSVAPVAPVESVAPVVDTTDSGCYPKRSYDMSKIEGKKDGQVSFEDYQTFTSTM